MCVSNIFSLSVRAKYLFSKTFININVNFFFYNVDFFYNETIKKI